MLVLAFRMGRETYCLKLSDVSEVVAGVPVFSLPRLAPPLEGVFQLRGRVIAVLSLPAFFRIPMEEEHTEIAVLADPAQHLGVRVPGMLETVNLRMDASQQVTEESDSAVLETIVCEDQQIYHVVSAAKLLSLARDVLADRAAGG
jgi:chemotaxis signal transduction protein